MHQYIGETWGLRKLTPPTKNFRGMIELVLNELSVGQLMLRFGAFRSPEKPIDFRLTVGR
jgi:hypothetical protein